MSNGNNSDNKVTSNNNEMFNNNDNISENNEETSSQTCKTESDGSGSDLSGPDFMDPRLISDIFQNQQGLMVHVMAMFLMHDGKNVCEHFSEIKNAIEVNSRCIMKLNETLAAGVQRLPLKD